MDKGYPTVERYLVTDTGMRLLVVEETDMYYKVKMPYGSQFKNGFLLKGVGMKAYTIVDETLDNPSYWRKRALKAEDELRKLKGRV